MYPITFAADDPNGNRNRLTAFFRFIVAIPWLIVASIYILIAYVAAIIAWFAIVFTGQYPEGLYNFNAKALRLLGRVNAFTYLATDEYPPFNGEPDDSYPVRIGIPEPLPEYDRVKTGLRLIIGIPVLVLLYVQALIAEVVALIGWFTILFTGAIPEGLFKPLRSALAYSTRGAGYYILLLTEDYPPFSLEDIPDQQALPASQPAPAAPAQPAQQQPPPPPPPPSQ
jgi:Domain of unknown function (DUF4389)